MERDLQLIFSLPKMFHKLNVFSSRLQLDPNKIMLYVQQPIISVSSQNPKFDQTQM